MPRRHRTGTERDLEGLAARAKRQHPSSDQLQDLAEAVEDESSAAPQQEWEGVSTGVTQRIEEDPDLKRLYVKIERGLSRERSKRASDIMDAMGKRPPAEVMSKLERTIRRLKYLIVAVAIPAGSSVILVGKYLTDRAAVNERALIERQQLIDRVGEHERTIKALSDLANKNATLIETIERERYGRRYDDRDSSPKAKP